MRWRQSRQPITRRAAGMELTLPLSTVQSWLARLLRTMLATALIPASTQLAAHHARPARFRVSIRTWDRTRCCSLLGELRIRDYSPLSNLTSITHFRVCDGFT